MFFFFGVAKMHKQPTGFQFFVIALRGFYFHEIEHQFLLAIMDEKIMLVEHSYYEIGLRD